MQAYRVGWYEDQILPRLVDRACGTAELRQWRELVVAGLTGTVVEIGFGSGSNLSAYGHGVERVLAVEPSATARRLAADRVAESSIAVEYVGVDGASLPLGDASCDAALSTFTLCTVPDVEQALAELLRVVRPGGRFHFLEHGLSPEAGVARWQRRLDPIERRLAGGCHLTRRPADLVEIAGFGIESVESFHVRGPKPWTWITLGRAIRP
ncbi:MAG: class I SAM-dependent methyltransferase [Ilumatobacteraceae bacterium]